MQEKDVADEKDREVAEPGNLSQIKFSVVPIGFSVFWSFYHLLSNIDFP